MNMEAIKIENLKKIYKGGTHALKGIDLQVGTGDFFALLGANGAGKTTIIGILTGTVNKTGGKAFIHGMDIDKVHDTIKRDVGIVPQEFNFNIFEKVEDIVVTQAGFYGLKRHEALKRAEKILKDLNLWDKRHQKSMSLSGGMKRRLMIARALIHEPKLLILDEPTAGVDVELRHGMWEYLTELNKSGVTILLTTHYIEEAEQLCRNVAIIKEGEIVKTGSVKELLTTIDKQTYVVEVDQIASHVKLDDFKWSVLDDRTVEVEVDQKKTLNNFITCLDKEGILVRDLRPKGNRLEKLFLNILNS
ncbi:ATP-binding cassette domain-containing protein [Candidatus Peregrinibacteria bacterium]|nr:ATP-binding cassette domain-containing protein [Candidatus Peregrinibacteria bacterium]